MKKSLITLALLSVSSASFAFNVWQGIATVDITEGHKGNYDVVYHNSTGEKILGSIDRNGKVQIGGVSGIVIKNTDGTYTFQNEKGSSLFTVNENGNVISGHIPDMSPGVPSNPIEDNDVSQSLPGWGVDTPNVDTDYPHVAPDYGRSIAAVEQDLFLFKQEVNQRFLTMEDRIDQVGASLHAVTNARPMVSAGQTAFGVGMGFSGSVEAIAVGVGHAFGDSGWSASGTINHATGTGNVGSDTSAGFGVQFAF
ncbi:hypothetical protein ACQEXU_11895 [Vibrio sp. TRT 21S02]|uniref:hypothetical protein n=1 Tax=Vibrio sp. TRT 21S02 TaxID=3418507 RepID=UPI003CECB667